MSDGWGSAWPTSGTAINQKWQNEQAIAMDLAKLGSDKTILTEIKDGEITRIKELNNTVPTHDSYTNPNAEIYFSCDCGQILDPGTKRFASLCKAAGDQGWKIRWGATSYVAHCVECGKDVE